MATCVCKVDKLSLGLIRLKPPMSTLRFFIGLRINRILDVQVQTVTARILRSCDVFTLDANAIGCCLMLIHAGSVPQQDELMAKMALRHKARSF